MADAPLIYPDEAAIIAIGTRFASCTLPKSEWTHAAHFAACLWLLRCRPDLIAERDMPGMIRAYNESTGGVNSDEAGYHETITQASIRATRYFLADQPETAPLQEVHARLMAGFCGHRDWMLEYWSKNILMSAAARKNWITPDLLPLPF